MRFEVEGIEVTAAVKKMDQVRYYGRLPRLPDVVSDGFPEAKYRLDCDWLKEVVTPAEAVDEWHPITVATLVNELAGGPDGAVVGKFAITRLS